MCANECFQMKMDGQKTINGATLDKTTCYCEVSQNRTWYSKGKMNCKFKTNKKPIKGEYFLYVLSYISTRKD